jgi:hypothetical protein
MGAEGSRGTGASAPRRRCRGVPSAGCVAPGDRCLVPQGAGAPMAISVPGSEGPGRVAAFGAPGPRATGATPPSAGARGPPGPRTGGPPLNKSTFQTNLCGRRTGFRIVAVPIRGRGIYCSNPEKLPVPPVPKVPQSWVPRVRGLRAIPYRNRPVTSPSPAACVPGTGRRWRPGSLRSTEGSQPAFEDA